MINPSCNRERHPSGGQLRESASAVPLNPLKQISAPFHPVTPSTMRDSLVVTNGRMSTDCHFSALRVPVRRHLTVALALCTLRSLSASKAVSVIKGKGRSATALKGVDAGPVALERSSPAGEVAVVPEELASRCGRYPGSGYPSHTCTAGRLCRIASGPPTQPRRPVHSQ
jgi:hypothetical protein